MILNLKFIPNIEDAERIETIKNIEGIKTNTKLFLYLLDIYDRNIEIERKLYIAEKIG